jgi:hypothetical protein
MLRRDVIHVAPHGDNGWVVRRGDREDPIAVYRTQDEAQEEARRMAREEHVEYILDSRQGATQDLDNYDHGSLQMRRRQRGGASMFLRRHETAR